MVQGFNCYRRRGFTLLEILITIVILVTGGVILAQILSTGIFADSEVESSGVALRLAQEKMEEIKDAASYAAVDGYAAGRANIGGDFADFDRQVTVAGDPKQVNVIVYWNSKGQERNINLVTLLADYDY